MNSHIDDKVRVNLKGIGPDTPIGEYNDEFAFSNTILDNIVKKFVHYDDENRDIYLYYHVNSSLLLKTTAQTSLKYLYQIVQLNYKRNHKTNIDNNQLELYLLYSYSEIY